MKSPHQPRTQAKLLRVIQEREFMRLGGTEQLKVDVRIVAAFQRRSPLRLFAKAVSRRFVSPPERDPPPDSAAARPSRKMCPFCWRISWTAMPGKLEATPAIHASGDEASDGLDWPAT